jgi:hypothetical protein
LLTPALLLLLLLLSPVQASSRHFNLTLFDKGEYSGATNKQDDYAVMSNFLDVLPQQYGRSTASATPLSASSSVAGVISNQGQTDFFSFKAPAGDISITAMGAGTVTVDRDVYNIGNLNMQVTLYNAAGDVLQTATPSHIADGAKLSTTLPASGTYFVSVKGVGAGNPQQYGYSDYGIRGRYVLSVGDPRIPNNDAIDCVGSWDCTKCDTKCGGGSRTCIFRIVDPGQEGGIPCGFSNGFVRSVDCNTQDCPARNMKLASLKVDKVAIARGRVRCRAVAVIRASTGEALKGVMVVGRWSGDQAMVAAGDVDSSTSDFGVAIFNTKPVSSKQCTFTVSGATLAGYTFIKTQTQVTKTIRW